MVQVCAFQLINIFILSHRGGTTGPDGKDGARSTRHHAAYGGGQRSEGNGLHGSERVVQQIARGDAGKFFDSSACLRMCLGCLLKCCLPSLLQLILTERGATKVHGKISFIDLAGSERGADTYSSPNPDTFSFCNSNFDFQLPQ